MVALCPENVRVYLWVVSTDGLAIDTVHLSMWELHYQKLCQHHPKCHSGKSLDFLCVVMEDSLVPTNIKLHMKILSHCGVFPC